MNDVPVGGSVDARFESVREAFVEVVGGQPGTGAALAVWHDGRWVVDLHGGWADAGHARPWAPDTLVMPYSVTKPFAAVTVLVLADRGVLDLDEPLQTWWPELRARTTLREVLAHRTGLVVLDEPAPEAAFYDWELMCRLLGGQEPAWPPGTAQGESALFYGHLLGEVVRRVDGRSLGQVLRDDGCGPLGLDFHVGLAPDELAGSPSSPASTRSSGGAGPAARALPARHRQPAGRARRSGRQQRAVAQGGDPGGQRSRDRPGGRRPLRRPRSRDGC